jgi:lysyl-tRNA synthetase class 2
MRSEDFRPCADWDTLRRRAALLAAVREFFSARGFLEVETPLLSTDVVVDRHLDPLCTTLYPDPRRPDAGPRLWLQTSPEAGMKRLLAAGGEAIYQVTRSFRSGESGPRHNPEFTIVEWYRRGDDLAAGMNLLSDLCEALLGRGPAERLSYAAAMRRHAGVDPHAATIERMAGVLLARGATPPPSMKASDRDGWLNLLLAELVEPHLGQGRPTILYHFPASQAMLAEIVESADSPDEPPREVAQRFELFVEGVELANGYYELTCADELRRRMDAACDERVADGKSPLPGPQRLLAAIRAGLPRCCGCALGFDRVVMLAAGKKSIAEVLAFPIDRA